MMTIFTASARIARLTVAAGLAALALTTLGSISPRTTAAAQPDLVMDRVTLNRAGTALTVRFHNTTAATGSDFSVTVYHCIGDQCSETYHTVEAMAADVDGFFTVDVFLQGITSARACIDHSPFRQFNNRVKEANENNNCRENHF